MNQFNFDSRHILIPVMLCVAVTFGCRKTGSVQPGNAGTRPSSSFGELRAHFPDPDMLNAPFAFWFWDDTLDNARVAEMAGWPKWPGGRNGRTYV